jgi:hypothetical protein
MVFRTFEPRRRRPDFLMGRQRTRLRTHGRSLGRGCRSGWPRWLWRKIDAEPNVACLSQDSPAWLPHH